MDFKGSKTMQNLMNSFAGESQARQRYYIFGEKAKDENLQIIADLFESTAQNEREHGEAFYEVLTENLKKGVMLPVTASYPVVMGTTLENLKSAAEGENEEGESIYPGFAKTAAQEGFGDIAKLFERVATIEKFHRDRFICYADLLEANLLFTRPTIITWHCTNCGYLHTAFSAPDVCPVCGKPKGWFDEMRIC